MAILRDWYPITVEELRDELSVRADLLERALKSLMVKGMIVLEPLSDKTYIRLLVPVPDVLVASEGKGRKKKARSQPRKLEDDDSIMYR